MKTIINVGSRIRSFDFDNHDLKGDRACYVEGIVMRIGPIPGVGECNHYEVKVTKLVLGGVDTGFVEGLTVFPPVNGSQTWTGKIAEGVALIS